MPTTLQRSVSANASFEPFRQAFLQEHPSEFSCFLIQNDDAVRKLIATKPDAPGQNLSDG
jgi:hypothetical protein